MRRQEISDAISDAGWRLVLGVLRTRVRVGSLVQAAELASRLAAAAGAEADERLRLDLRRDRVMASVQTLSAASVTAEDIDLARRLATVIGEYGLTLDPDGQLLEIAIDALDIPSIRPFWKAALGYVDEPGHTGPKDPLVDPAGQGPAVWFQQMDAPRPQRNRIHLDISVPHDGAARRLDAAFAAGGRLVNDAEAPAFWVLADAEGNEACITTWQGRD